MRFPIRRTWVSLCLHMQKSVSCRTCYTACCAHKQCITNVCIFVVASNAKWTRFPVLLVAVSAGSHIAVDTCHDVTDSLQLQLDGMRASKYEEVKQSYVAFHCFVCAFQWEASHLQTGLVLVLHTFMACACAVHHDAHACSVSMHWRFCFKSGIDDRVWFPALAPDRLPVLCCGGWVIIV